MTDKFKPVPNIPKTYEQFVLEDKQLTPEQTLNQANLEQLRNEYQTGQQTVQIQQNYPFKK